MRISDWSSDVCSSDLKELAGEFGLADRDIGNDLKLFSRQIDVAVGKSGSCASLTIAQAATNAFAVDRALVEFIAEPIEIIGAALGIAQLTLGVHEQRARGGRTGCERCAVVMVERMHMRSEEQTSELQSL